MCSLRMYMIIDGRLKFIYTRCSSETNVGGTYLAGSSGPPKGEGFCCVIGANIQNRCNSRCKTAAVFINARESSCNGNTPRAP